jgi:hypothetical protein
MGHKERNYAAEVQSPNGDGDYAYTDDPPTLLAVGLLANWEIREGNGEIIEITMKPLVVDTVFKQGEAVVQAKLPADVPSADVPSGAQAGGVRLFPLTDTEVVWTLTRGFRSLFDAEGKIIVENDGYGIASGWGGPAPVGQKDPAPYRRGGRPGSWRHPGRG